MAKISTYPTASPVSLSDMVIGTDVNSSNATKNFEVGDVLALANDPTILTSLVPYTGATGDVFLGGQGLSGDFVDVNTTLCQYIDIFQSLTIGEDAYISLNGDQGSAGEVMISQGTGTNPVWGSASSVVGVQILYCKVGGEAVIPGGTGNEIAASILIPANTLSDNDIIEITSRLGRFPSTSTCASYMYKNTTNSLTGATLIATFESMSAGENVQTTTRTLGYNTNVITFFSSTTASSTDLITGTAVVTSTAFNPAVDNYILYVVNSASATDAATITLTKAVKYSEV